ncbi:MAG: hypothetical protein Q7T10_20100 [Rhodoferax sp.]|uniref:hypothetical protein n=1 Tax=Rhodoferax sp. TaxID=50421 RepID=UPI0027228B9A|nr:hypothetical protein [Rhodoferax sp.]MDO8451103.1 hypothetical protein [Rhodoferax sp.]
MKSYQLHCGNIVRLSKLVFALYALDSASHGKHVERLSGYLDQMEDTGSLDVLDGLSSGERAAVLLAAKRDGDLSLPVNSFLLADPHLQKWVMEKRGFSNQVGWPLGEIPSFK